MLICYEIWHADLNNFTPNKNIVLIFFKQKIIDFAYLSFVKNKKTQKPCILEGLLGVKLGSFLNFNNASKKSHS